MAQMKSKSRVLRANKILWKRAIKVPLYLPVLSWGFFISIPFQLFLKAGHILFLKAVIDLVIRRLSQVQTFYTVQGRSSTELLGVEGLSSGILFCRVLCYVIFQTFKTFLLVFHSENFFVERNRRATIKLIGKITSKMSILFLKSFSILLQNTEHDQLIRLVTS